MVQTYQKNAAAAANPMAAQPRRGPGGMTAH